MLTPINNISEYTTEEDLCLLFHEFQNGNQEAFTYLYNYYVNMLFNYGCKITSDREILKDCIHDVFIKMYHKRKELKNVLNFRSYLFVCLKNKLYDELRKKKYLSEVQIEEYNPASDRDVETNYIKTEKETLYNKKVSSLLKELSVRQREAITLYYIEEKKYDDICMIMNINYQSLRNLIHRGLTKLRVVASQAG